MLGNEGRPGTTFINYPSDYYQSYPTIWIEDFSVLYIDDEDNKLKILFGQTLRKDFKIFSAINAEDGLRIAQREEITWSVLRSTHLPGMTGTSSLSKWFKINPDPDPDICLPGILILVALIDASIKGKFIRFTISLWNMTDKKKIPKGNGCRHLFYADRVEGSDASKL